MECGAARDSTLAGFAVAAQAEAGAAAAGAHLVAVPQQTHVRAAAGLPVLIKGTRVTPHCPPREDGKKGREGGRGMRKSNKMSIRKKQKTWVSYNTVTLKGK